MSIPPTSGSPEGASTTTRIEKLPIPRLLFGLLHRRFTGILHLDQSEPDPGERHVWFRGGMPVFTDWVAPRLRLGQLLLQARAIADADLQSALANASEAKVVLGRALLDLGVVDRHLLHRTLHDQCAQKLYLLFRLRHGVLRAEACEHPRGAADGSSGVNVLELIRRGIEAHFAADEIRAHLGEAVHGRVMASPAFSRYRAHFNFEPAAEPAIGKLVHGTTFTALATTTGMDETRALRLLYVLDTCQMLADKDVRAAAPARPTTRPTVRAPTPPPSTVEAEPAARPADTPEDFMVRLEQVEARIASRTHAFELLGVPLFAGKREVRRAFSDLSRDFHPDTLAATGRNHLRARVEAVFSSLSEAHLLLSDSDQRERLKKEVESGTFGTPAAKPQSVEAVTRAAFESEAHARNGDKYLRTGRWTQALAEFRQALELVPEEADVQAAIAYCEWEEGGRKPDVGRMAAATIAALVHEHPKLARAQHLHGLILLALGSTEAALVAFDAAFANDFRLVDAERQARAIRVRRSEAKKAEAKPADGERKGITGLFKRRS